MNRLILSIFFILLYSISSNSQTVNNVEIKELNAEQFKQKVWNFDKNKTFLSEGKLPVILDFHATWCRPCKMLAPHLQEIQNKYKGKLIVYKIDVDKETAIAQLFKVEAMPTIVFIQSKNKFKCELGYRDFDELEKLVKQYFSL